MRAVCKIISCGVNRCFMIPVLSLFLLFPAGDGMCQKMSVSTNLLEYLNFGTINGEFGLSISPKWSIYLQGRFNPFTFGSENGAMSDGYSRQMQRRQVSAFAGARYWFWYTNSGWFVSSHAGFIRYNTGGIFKNDTYQGDAYGLTLGGGYSLMISRRLNLDFGMGIMAGYTSYIKYMCPGCGRVVGEEKRLYIAPDNFLVQLSVLF